MSTASGNSIQDHPPIAAYFWILCPTCLSLPQCRPGPILPPRFDSSLFSLSPPHSQASLPLPSSVRFIRLIHLALGQPTLNKITLAGKMADLQLAGPSSLPDIPVPNPAYVFIPRPEDADYIMLDVSRRNIERRLRKIIDSQAPATKSPARWVSYHCFPALFVCGENRDLTTGTHALVLGI